VLSRCRVGMELATTRGDILCVEFSGDVSESVPFPVAGFGLTSRRPVEFSRPALGCPNAAGQRVFLIRLRMWHDKGRGPCGNPVESFEIV
jgi:hypothetical protein